MDPARDELGRALNERRLELGIRWREVAQRAGMSEQNLIKIRKGRIQITPYAAAAIERALYWQGGSVAAILAGEEPTRLPDAHGPMRARWQTYRVTAEEALVLLEEAMEDYGPGGFWKAFDEIYFGREDTQQTPRQSSDDQQGQTA